VCPQIFSSLASKVRAGGTCAGHPSTGILIIWTGNRCKVVVVLCLWRVQHFSTHIKRFTYSSDGSGSNIFVACVGSGQPFSVWGWKNSTKNPKFYNFFPWGQKKLLQAGSKSARAKDRSSLLFTAGQKYAWVGSGQNTSLT